MMARLEKGNRNVRFDGRQSRKLSADKIKNSAPRDGGAHLAGFPVGLPRRQC
jgi:hypothetical protein